MNRFSSLRVRLVGIVFLAVMPALVLLFYTDLLPWYGLLIGLMALTAAWFGGELFVVRQLRTLLAAVKRLTSGDLTSRVILTNEPTELGDLARAFDVMADKLERQIHEREGSEAALLNRAHQQTVVAALGQFALVSSDLSALLNQTVMLMSQTLEPRILHDPGTAARR